MSTGCPYCNSVRSILLGHVYCSNHGHSMEKLDTGVLMIQSERMEETAEHISRLSIRYNLTGEQYYKIGSNDHHIDPKKYVIVNQGQRYKTAAPQQHDQQMIIVAFKPGFAEEILHDMVTAEDRLLDDPFGRHQQPVHFYEHTYQADQQIVANFKILRQLMNADMAVKQETDLTTIYSDMMRQMLGVHRNTLSIAKKLPVVRISTRAELYRRLCIARDYLDAHTSQTIHLEEVARQASLSIHHFKRSFTLAFGISPHQYHVNKRLEKARHLLADKKYSSAEICQLAGFQNTSSFIRLFKQRFGYTPGKFPPENR